jgi:hypothetical protein
MSGVGGGVQHYVSGVTCALHETAVAGRVVEEERKFPLIKSEKTKLLYWNRRNIGLYQYYTVGISKFPTRSHKVKKSNSFAGKPRVF